eukprot:11853227-Prorocentrum_lima.AAC.1
MHDKGLAHGDIYAHNVLADDDGRCSLVDLGASFFYRKANMDCEKMEVRAYGILLEEMTEVCEGQRRHGVSGS